MLQEHKMKHVVRIAQNFLKSGEDVVVEPYGNGIIHDTYLANPAKGQEKFILQRLNLHVFKKPELVMQNIRIVCDHVHKNLEQQRDAKFEQWQMLEIMPASDGQDYFVDEQGSFWRGFSFIDNAMVLENVANQEEAREVGTALGRFHFLVHDLEPGSLHDTLPGFHEISHYLSHFDRVVEKSGKLDHSSRLQYCFDFIKSRRQWAPVIENALAEGRLQFRITHGDPKSNNVMLDINTHKAVSLIDLDTVKPGLILYDIADCLRSCCNTSDETAGDFTTVAFDSNLCGALLSGYLPEYPFLTDADYEYLYDAICIIAFELGLRFVIDFLESDVYFKTEYKGHNLDRAMVQFKLAESIETQENQLTSLIGDCRGRLT
jgi:Ser/Thr protein kinase RdoA (MazF antagonist)